MAEDARRKLAVLIDADNTSPKVADGLFEEVAKIGEASLRRIYGDFSKGQQAGWEKVLQKHAILAQQQFAYTTGKNSSDIALVIDAMDLLHSGRFDGFCLVSSDSDFTRLAARIREQGIDVYGIGQQKTPESFRQACTRFIFTENFVARAGESPAAGQGGAPADRRGGGADRQGARADGGRRRGLVPARHRRPAAAEPLARVRHPHLRPRRSSATSSTPPAASRSTATQGLPLRPKPGAEAPVTRSGRRAGPGSRRCRSASRCCSTAIGLPAALLLGPMVAGIVFSLAGARPRGAGARLPPRAGARRLMIARILALPVLAEIARGLAGLRRSASLSVTPASAVLGWMLARLRILPGTTAVWGSSPGAASAMTLMSASFGADMRLVAFMQYTRVVIVATLAAVVARVWGDADAGRRRRSAGSPRPTGPGSRRRWRSRSACGGSGRRCALPAGPLLLPLVARGAAAERRAPRRSSCRRCCSPSPTRVDRLGRRAALRPRDGAPRGAGAAGGARLDRLPGGDSAPASPRSSSSSPASIPLTAYLAMSPGGADTVAIIASSTQVDVAFVMAMQTARLLFVLLITGPSSRALADRAHVAARPRLAAVTARPDPLTVPQSAPRISCRREAVRANSKAPSPSG